MAKRLMTNVGVYVGGYEIGGYANEARLTLDTDEVDISAFNPGAWRDFLPGLISARIGVAGHADPEAVDKVLFDKRGANNEIITLCDPNASAGVSFFVRGAFGSLETPLRLGEPFGFSMAAATSTMPLVRGDVLRRSTAETATADGTAYQLGAVSATQSIYAALHVFSIAGTGTPTLTVKIQSDDGAGFGTPTDQLTFTAVTDVTDVGAEWKQAGPSAITDDWWRATWTISGTGPSFGFIVSFGFL